MLVCPVKPSPVHIQVVRTYTPSNISSGSSLDITKSDPFLEHICQLSNEEQIELLGDLFCSLASQMCGVSVPADFIKLSLHGMQRLQCAGRLNVLYLLAKGFGTDLPGRDDSLFPTRRMPMGLLQYMAQFFVSKRGQHVSIISIWMLHSYH